jgi:hypothetical protein
MSETTPRKKFRVGQKVRIADRKTLTDKQLQMYPEWVSGMDFMSEGVYTINQSAFERGVWIHEMTGTFFWFREDWLFSLEGEDTQLKLFDQDREVGR